VDGKDTCIRRHRNGLYDLPIFGTRVIVDGIINTVEVQFHLIINCYVQVQTFCTRCAGVRWQTAACEVIISSSIALSAIQARWSENAWVQVNSEVDVGANAKR
jgi:hypothetical protein